MSSKIISISFNAEQWNSSRALRYVRKMGLAPMKRCIRRDGILKYQIRDAAKYQKTYNITLDKARKVSAVCAKKVKSTTQEVEIEIPADIPVTEIDDTSTSDVLDSTPE